MITTDRIIVIAGAIVAFLLQVILAPHIAVFSTVPNFMAAYCLAMAVARPGSAGLLMPFIMGLLYDLASGGPVGAMAFSLTAFSALGSWVFPRVNNDTAFMAVVVLAVSVFLTELAYGLLFLLSGYSAGVLEAFAYRVLPCFIYNFVIALVVYLVAMRLLNRDPVMQSEIKQL